MSFQNNILQIPGYSLFNLEDHSRNIGIIFFIVSVVAHGLFFFSLIFFQDFKLPKQMPPVIQIDLVSFAPEPAFENTKDNIEENQVETPQDTIPAKTKAIKQKQKKIQTIKPDISLKAKPKNLKELIASKKKEKEKKKIIAKPEKKEKIEPKKEIDSEEVLKKAREQLENTVEKQKQDRLQQALNRLKKKVKNQGSKANKGTVYAQKGTPQDIYNQIIKFALHQNWVFNDILARMDQQLEVRIILKILKNGEIRDVIYETRSGNRYLDESAKRAIKKANPLPPLPAGMRSYDLLIGFSPRGLK